MGKVVYYDENTQRTARFEASGEKNGFHILPLGQTLKEEKIVRRVDEGLRNIEFY